ncbi:hypothetical protein R3P38DRAFT_3217170 [Favolaschia claudopus]|uniref:Uncharacterized protein n=1 Tax=Favolaschia claudopus TaxID=2862362 RepID=A0AAW0A7N0_9AGAR
MIHEAPALALSHCPSNTVKGCIYAPLSSPSAAPSHATTPIPILSSPPRYPTVALRASVFVLRAQPELHTAGTLSTSTRPGGWNLCLCPDSWLVILVPFLVACRLLYPYPSLETKPAQHENLCRNDAGFCCLDLDTSTFIPAPLHTLRSSNSPFLHAPPPPQPTHSPRSPASSQRSPALRYPRHYPGGRYAASARLRLSSIFGGRWSVGGRWWILCGDDLEEMSGCGAWSSMCGCRPATATRVPRSSEHGGTVNSARVDRRCRSLHSTPYASIPSVLPVFVHGRLESLSLGQRRCRERATSVEGIAGLWIARSLLSPFVVPRTLSSSGRVGDAEAQRVIISASPSIDRFVPVGIHSLLSSSRRRLRLTPTTARRIGYRDAAAGPVTPSDVTLNRHSI